MNLAERESLKKLDDLVLNASKKELEQIQEVDIKTQLDGLSFYDVYVNSTPMANQSIRQETRDSMYFRK